MIMPFYEREEKILNVLLEKDSKVLIVENHNTGPENSSFYPI